ncbi:MAG: RICIN domain-containing protein [Oscillospiraceae bacterium]|nr:RICIN domain-containing protein [Oscillospiraceae bacterium]
MNRKKLQSILVCAVCTASAAGAAMPAHTASAESFTYPVQEFRFAVGDTDRNLNTSGTAPGDYVTSETQNGTDAEKWYLHYISAGVYEIVNAGTGTLLTNDGGLAVMQPDADAANQRWNITGVKKDFDGYYLYYKITSNADPNAALTFHVNSNSFAVESYTGDLTQYFKLDLDGLEGYAANAMTPSGEKAGTIGGLLGETVFVATADDLEQQLNSVGAQTIVITADIDMQKKGNTRIRDNKTIVGSYAKHTIYDSQFRTNDAYGAEDDSPSDNIVFRNLDMQAKNVANRILINIWSSRQIWIDHINFNSTLTYDRTGNGQDEVGKFIWINTPYDNYMDAKDRLRSPDYVTISYCKFTHRYWTVAYGTQNDEITRDRTTLLYNWWNECVRRCPQLGNGSAHVVCNYFSGYTSNGSGTAQIIGGDGSDMVSENCRFNGFSNGQALSMGGGTDPARDSGSYISTALNGTPQKISFSPKNTSKWYPNQSNYGYALIAAYNTSGNDVKDFCTRYAGCFSSESGIRYLTDSDLAGFVQTGYASPFKKAAAVGNDPVSGGAALNTQNSYIIRNAGSGLPVSAAEGTLVQDTAEAVWKLEAAEGGWYRIYNADKSACLSVAEGKADNGAAIVLGAPANTDAERFRFVSDGAGGYTIRTKASSGSSCFGVTAGSKDAGTGIIQWACDGTASQSWQISAVGSLFSLTVADQANAENWSILADLQVGAPVFNDREGVTYTALPDVLLGAEAVVTACDSKNTDGDLAVLTAAADLTVYVGLDSRVTAAPAWLADWTKTDLTVQNSKDVTFDIYARNLTAGEQVTLGTNGQSSGCVQYVVFAQENAAQVTETTTTTASTETTTTTASTEPGGVTVWGDADCNGFFELSDCVLLAKAAAGIEGSTLTAKGKSNCDLYADNSLSGKDLQIVLQLMAGIYTNDQMPVQP